NSGGEAILGSSDPGGMRSDDTDNRGVRWRRWNFSKSGATSCTGANAHTKPNANTDTDANTHTDSHANTHTHTHTHAERWDDGHDHVGGRVTTNVDGAAGDTCDIREQRHAGSRDGLQSASRAHRLS